MVHHPRIASGSRMTAVLILAGSVLAVACLVPAGASGWTQPRLVTEAPGNISEPSLSSNSRGTTALSYTRNPLTGQGRILVAFRGPRQVRFGGSRLVSNPALESQNSKVGVGPDGAVTVVWVGQPTASSTYTVVMAATKGASARRFSRPFRLSPLGMNSDPDSLSLSVGPRGRTVVAWVVENAEGALVVQSARRAGSRSRFVKPSATQEISRPETRPLDSRNAGLTALVADDGSYNYLWTGSGLMYVRTRGRSVRRQTVSSGESERQGVLAIAPTGAATVAWTNGQSDVRIARRSSALASFAPGGTISTDASELDIGMARDGTTTIVYRSPLPSGWQPVAITRRPNQPLFGSEKFISPLGGYDPRVAVSPGGKVRVVFGPSDSFLAPGVVERGPRASSFGTPVAFSPPSSTNGAYVTTGGNGWAAAVWVRNDLGSQILYSVDRP